MAGLAPSTYQQVFTDYFNSGYPLGAFLPLGIAGKLTGQDVAWLFQPMIALFAVMLALSIYALSARLVSSKPLRRVSPSSERSRRSCSPMRSGAASRSSQPRR